MISNNLFKIRLRSLDHKYDAVDDFPLNQWYFNLSFSDGKIFRRENRIMKKNRKINRNTEE